MLHNLMHNKVLHERVMLVAVEVFDAFPMFPRSIACRSTRKLKADFYSGEVVQYGFMDEPDIPHALSFCARSRAWPFEMMETSFFLGRSTLIPKMSSNMVLVAREAVHHALFRNASSATSFYKIPSNRVVELGTQVVL